MASVVVPIWIFLFWSAKKLKIRLGFSRSLRREKWIGNWSFTRSWPHLPNSDKRILLTLHKTQTSKHLVVMGWRQRDKIDSLSLKVYLRLLQSSFSVLEKYSRGYLIFFPGFSRRNQFSPSVKSPFCFYLGGDFSPISLGEMIGHLHATFFDPLSLYTLPQWSIIVLFSGLHVASELFPYRWPQKQKGLKDPFFFRSPSLTSWDLYQENNSATPLCELISLSSGWKLSRRKSLPKWGGGYKNWDP